MIKTVWPKGGRRPKKMTVEERFWEKVDIRDASECWEWLASKRNGGYGQFSVAGKTLRANRIAYEFFYGPFDESLFVLHKCDNPGCVNPAHLFLGSHRDNMRDMVEKERAASGEAHKKAELSTKDVLAIVELYNSGKHTHASIAELYTVEAPAIYKILNGRTWGNVTGIPLTKRGIVRKLTEEDVLRIVRLYQTGNYTQKQVSEFFNVAKTAIGDILVGKSWSHVTGIKYKRRHR